MIGLLGAIVYRVHCDACRAAGLQPPTPEAWSQLIEQEIREALTDDDDGGGAR